MLLIELIQNYQCDIYFYIFFLIWNKKTSMEIIFEEE